MEERAKILKMLEDGIITAQEAEELFKSMEEKKEKKPVEGEIFEDEIFDRIDEEKKVKAKLAKALEKMRKALEKIEEAELKASKKIVDSEVSKKVQAELRHAKEEVKKAIADVEEKLNRIGDKTVKDNFKDFGKQMESLGEKMKGWFTKNE
ncbi:MAG: hypothetical protein RBR48_01500 [Bacilli bacterium]|jgi:ABC-type phosphate transport system auxiliary subunit|nr:hypothetical protein [Bacilli bacterium]MDD3348244.1 hypothetical protein [Bacilli bacterium]MDD4056277.1 hypothetical protein [Bacilli bacterium]MDY0208842.1 hypothetical protein [Bacilli bacterium]